MEGSGQKLGHQGGEGVRGDNGLNFRLAGTHGYDGWELSSPGSSPSLSFLRILGTGMEGRLPLAWSPGNSAPLVTTCMGVYCVYMLPPSWEEVGVHSIVCKAGAGQCPASCTFGHVP